MDIPQKAVFGFGSLVNTGSHALFSLGPATLQGWRRCWVQAADRPVAFLSIEPANGAIHGLTLRVDDTDWHDLDAREHAYLRRNVSHQITDNPQHRTTVAYQADPTKLAPASAQHPILLSYLDVVIAGYIALSPDGAAHFFETTAGWGPVLDDRANPRYPRAQHHPDRVTRYVDDALAALSVLVQPA